MHKLIEPIESFVHTEQADTLETIMNDIMYVIKNNIDTTKLKKKEKEFLFDKLNELLIKIDIINWTFIDKLDNDDCDSNSNSNSINNISTNMGVCSYKIIVDLHGHVLCNNENKDIYSLWNNQNDVKEEPFIINIVGKVMPESYILSCNYLFSQKDFINSFIRSIKYIVDLRKNVKDSILNDC
jgi:hypothetical protein